MREDTGHSQTLKAVLGLRGLIIKGHFQPGERVLEQMLVERLGVSRTPARAAMARVCEEGLMEPLAAGGYVVARFSERDVFDAIAIRGNLEAMAARLAAERGVPRALMLEMKLCLGRLDDVIVRLRDDPDVTGYVRENDHFHELLLQAAQSPMLKRTLEHHTNLPFAMPNSFVEMSSPDDARVLSLLSVAQEQHHSIVEAMANREGSRAASLTVEHSRSAWKFLNMVFQRDGQPQFAGMRLVERDDVA